MRKITVYPEMGRSFQAESLVQKLQRPDVCTDQLDNKNSIKGQSGSWVNSWASYQKNGFKFNKVSEVNQNWPQSYSVQLNHTT